MRISDWSSDVCSSDLPVHGTLRSMVNPAFTPKKMAVLEDKIRQYARDYILAFRDKGACEFMADFAFEFPIKVFLELMGLKQERTREFMEWEHKKGRASCRERVCQYGEISVVGVTVKKK